jgi:uridine kinase
LFLLTGKLRSLNKFSANLRGFGEFMGKNIAEFARFDSSWPSWERVLEMPSFKIDPVLGTLQATFSEPCMVIAIAGLSASGKTTLARDLAEELDGSLLQMDDYYRDIPAGVAVEDLNWDDPAMFHLDEWREHLEILGRGESVAVPRYDFRTSLRSGYREVRASRVILAEGQFALHPHAIPNHLCLNIFVDVDAESAFARRVERDSVERGRSEDSVRTQWEEHVLPAWRNWVEPSRLRADLVLRGDAKRSENLGLALRALDEVRARFATVR